MATSSSKPIFGSQHEAYYRLLRSMRQAILREAAAAVATPDEVRIYDPVAHIITRRAGFERAQLLMHSRSRGALQQFLSELSAHLFAAAPRHIRWHLDVDPIEFD